jgi:hypothetical protein
MDADLREMVRERAGRRCEYCLLHQEDEPYFSFHIEHVVAKQHGGSDRPRNLALACHHDNLHKGPNLTGIDPKTGKVVRLFHPRRHSWDRHFRWDGPRLLGRTPTGRATVAVLAMNHPDRIALRELLIDEGVFPP